MPLIRAISRRLGILLGVGVTVGVLWMGITDGTGTAVNRLDSPVPGGSTVTVRNYDGDGHEIVIDYKESPKRVLSTYPGATELLITLGLGDRIIATVAPYGAEPESLRAAYDAVPKVSAPYVPTKEEVLDLQPDLIMGWNHHFLPGALGNVRQWYQRGIPTYVVPATVRKGYPTLESTVYPFIDDVGRIFHIEERADAYKSGLRDRVNRVMSRSEGRGHRPTVLVLQSHGNSTYSVYGETYIIYDIVRKAGGNALVPGGMRGVGPERILGYDPDYIVFVVAGDEADEYKFTQDALQLLRSDEKLKHMRAVEAGHIIPVPFGDVNNGNGRVVDALERISEGLGQ